ncbi:MAG: flavin reductase [Prevotella sp.]|nr:flavin reductase [Prevotella sp.]
MEKTKLIIAVSAILTFMASVPAFAQEENRRSSESQPSLLEDGRVATDVVEDNGFKKFNVREDFTENGFQWFHDAELLAAGDKDKSNAMTIGWGGIGTLWGRTALTVYVAEKRYTKEFMDKAEYFTVMAFDVKDSKVLNYMGTKSGRDGDKAQALGLHTAYTANGTPYYTEASMVIECKIMYAAPFDPQYFKSDAPKRMYANFPAGIHSMYIGEVVNAWKK